MWQIEPSSEHRRDYQYQDIRLGSVCNNLPSKTYKAIYLSNDSKWAFEVVYAVERGLERCIYVKMIGDSDVHIGISLESILHYSDSPVTLVSIGTILSSINFLRDCKILNQDLQSIISPLFGREAVDREVVRLLEATDDKAFQNLTAKTWNPLYVNEPNVLGALINGAFVRSPHNELRGINPLFRPMLRHNDPANNLSYRAIAFDGMLYCNQIEFDPITMTILKFPVAEFSLTVSFTDGLEGILNTGVMRYFSDPYSSVVQEMWYTNESILSFLGGVVQETLWAYGMVFDCDLYARQGNIDRSSLTISKNMFDEILFEFNDTEANHKVAVYNNLTSLALVSQGAGYKSRGV
jgi:hypothetical protein